MQRMQSSGPHSLDVSAPPECRWQYCGRGGWKGTRGGPTSATTTAPLLRRTLPFAAPWWLRTQKTLPAPCCYSPFPPTQGAASAAEPGRTRHKQSLNACMHQDCSLQPPLALPVSLSSRPFAMNSKWRRRTIGAPSLYTENTRWKATFKATTNNKGSSDGQPRSTTEIALPASSLMVAVDDQMRLLLAGAVLNITHVRSATSSQ